MAYLVIGALLVAAWAVAEIARAIDAHTTLAFLFVFGVPAVVVLVIFAVVRGASHHVAISRTPPALPRAKPRLPDPVTVHPVIRTAPEQASPFSSDGPGWDELVEEAERERLAAERAEMDKPGPREARPETCHRDGCGIVLDEFAWELDVLDEDGSRQERKFCSRECLNAWQDADVASRSNHAG